MLAVILDLLIHYSVSNSTLIFSFNQHLFNIYVQKKYIFKMDKTKEIQFKFLSW
jgi:hypothetical protein